MHVHARRTLPLLVVFSLVSATGLTGEREAGGLEESGGEAAPVAGPPFADALPPNGVWQREVRPGGESWTYHFTVPDPEDGTLPSAPDSPTAPGVRVGISRSGMAPGGSAPVFAEPRAHASGLTTGARPALPGSLPGMRVFQTGVVARTENAAAVPGLAPPPAQQRFTALGGLDLRADRAYLYSQPAAGGSPVAIPTLGQTVFFHLDWSLLGAVGTVSVTGRAVIDGGLFCTFAFGEAYDGNWYSWCDAGWSATAGPHTLRWDLDYDDTVVETDESNNSSAKTFTPDGVDLVAQRAYLRSAPGGEGVEVDVPALGQEVYLYMDWEVSGAADPFLVPLEARLDGAVICAGRLEASVDWTYYTWCNDAFAATPGSHVLEWTLDHTGEVAESDETNNAVDKTFEPGGVDIEALGARLRSAPDGGGIDIATPAVGQQVYLHVDWRIVGGPDPVPVTNLARIDGADHCAGVFEVGAGLYYSGCVAPWTAAPGPHTLEWFLDYPGDVAETNEGNNVASLEFATDGVDVAVLETYMRTGTNTGAVVSTPTAGQSVYFHVNWRMLADGGPYTVWKHAYFDGNPYCSFSTDRYGGTIWAAWCGDPWTATAGPHTLEWVLDEPGIVIETDETNNSATKHFDTAALDIEPLRAFLRTAAGQGGVEVAAPAVGQTVYVHADYRVTGDGGPVTIERRAVLDGETICSFGIADTVGADSVTWCNAGWAATAGPHTLQWDFDFNDAVVESDEGNNSVSTSFTSGGVDLQAVRAFLSTGPDTDDHEIATPSVGQPVWFNAELRVSGEGAPFTFAVRALLDGTEYCGGELDNSESTWTPHCTTGWIATAGPHTLRWEIDTADAIVETDESNNSASTGFEPEGVYAPDVRVAPLTLTFDPAKRGGPVHVAEPAAEEPPGINAVKLEALVRHANQQGTLRVIARLEVPFSPEGRLRAKQDVAAQRRSIARVREALLAKLDPMNASLIATFDYVPFAGFEVNGDGLRHMAALPEVAGVDEDRRGTPALASSNPVIGSPAAWASGFTGSGVTVAVVDTGVDKSHPWFNTGPNKIVSEGCFSTPTPPFVYSFCPGGVAATTEPGSGEPCDLPRCDHGTLVTGIVAGNDGAGPDFGVARDATVIALQTFSRVENEAWCGSPEPCAQVFEIDIIHAMERVYELRDDFDIAAVNMSLGFTPYSDQGACDADIAGIKAAIDLLRSVGIAAVVSTGNSGLTNAQAYPSCISSAVSVGATDDADLVASFSDVSAFTDLMAPGVAITTSEPGVGTVTKNGTSMSAPHVAGAWALMKQATPAASVGEIQAALRLTGTSVDDHREGATVTDLRRINIDLALQVNGVAEQAFTIFNDGDAVLTVDGMLLDEATAWIDWSPRAPFNVAPGGSRTVLVSVNGGGAPAGGSIRRLLIESNDPDESPYPGGVTIAVRTPVSCNGSACDDGYACTLDTCNPTTGACESLPADALCDDGDPCTDDWCDPLDPVANQGCVSEGAPPRVYFIDGDGDGFGDATNPVEACEQPPFYATDGTDCDDTNRNTHPNADEINDGQDNQCPGDHGYGVSDETSGQSGFPLAGDTATYCWPAQTGAASYDALRSASPAFSVDCAGATTASTCWTDAALPSPGAIYYYLNRAAAPHVGSWGQNDAGVERPAPCAR